ncbi:M12 family metallopeptidase [Hymenobacter chitinivorans]|uniref:Astacin (Peptidase family M12A) n=1 Tax=Hymenobacter chitinivorans DSM 11115 TaxID=1121954 RepID=A0A2M9BL40_9BACT|nr:M12 family metallopeptidase [Hymenobacter chitinivorans]PJJ58664.1 astacin (peptidase family M12A) [Hymenobacter chitinivorans DSM 11115]
MKTTRFSLLMLGLGLGMTAFSSCSKEQDAAAPASTAAVQAAKVEEAYPSQTGPAQVSKLGVYQQINGENILEGDIILTASQVNPTGPQTESAGRNTGKWPSAVVYYTIDAALPSQNRVTDAITHWQTYTAVRFVPRTTQANYVTFRVGSGCSSNIGMIGGRQYINLASGCTTGNTIHEIGHALGLFHEQTRNDRDTYVNILTQNIQSGYENNFVKYSTSGYSGTDFGALDFGSIMMYGSFSFSSNGQPTITKKDGSTFNIQRSALSAGDRAGIDIMY